MKTILLDTHVAIWFFNGSSKISETAKQAILNPDNQVYVSIISVWELAVKINIGKLEFAGGGCGFSGIDRQQWFSTANRYAQTFIGIRTLAVTSSRPV